MGRVVRCGYGAAGWTDIVALWIEPPRKFLVTVVSSCGVSRNQQRTESKPGSE